MEQTAQQERNATWYLLPIAGAAVSMLLTLRRLGRRKPVEAKEQELLKESKLDIQGAMNAALKHVRGTPVEVELREEHGMPAWQVQVVPRKGGPLREILVDARSGDILEMKSEFPEEAAA